MTIPVHCPHCHQLMPRLIDEDLGNGLRLSDLTQIERILVYLLATNAGRVVTYEDFIAAVTDRPRGPNARRTPNPQRTEVRTYVKRLRKKARHLPIRNIAGLGYMLDVPAQGIEARSGETTGSTEGESPVRQDAP